jgi:hypothetical protein
LDAPREKTITFLVQKKYLLYVGIYSSKNKQHKTKVANQQKLELSHFDSEPRKIPSAGTVQPFEIPKTPGM